MPTLDDQPQCSLCGALGAYRGATCYGCIKLTELTDRLTQTADALDALRHWINQRPELTTDPFIRDTLRYHSDKLHRILDNELARYTNA